MSRSVRLGERISALVPVFLTAAAIDVTVMFEEINSRSSEN